MPQEKKLCTECHSTIHEDDCSKRIECDVCQGEGRIENYTTTKDESTGYNEVVEGTGTYKPCWNCNQE